MKILGTALLAGALLASPAMAQSEEQGFYLGVGGGLTIVQESDINTSVSGIPVSGTLDFDPGFSVGATAGYKWPQSFRTELEYRYSRVGLDSASLSAGGSTVFGSVDGHATAHAFLANAWYDWDLKNGWMPYIGGGIGGFVLDIENTDSDTIFGGQAGGGIQYAITPKIIFDLGYRFVITQDPSFSSDVAGVSNVDGEYKSHNVLLSVRGHF